MPTCYHCQLEAPTPAQLIKHIVAARHRISLIRKWAADLCAHLKTAPTAALLFKHMTWATIDCGIIVYESTSFGEWNYDSELGVLKDFDSARARFKADESVKVMDNPDGNAEEIQTFGHFLQCNPVWRSAPDESCWGTATWMVIGYFLVLADLNIDKFEVYLDLVLAADSYWKPLAQRKITL